jgi:phage FluMu protein Com
MDDNLQVIKCTNCGKVLLEASGEVKKICPKCKEINHVVTTSKGVINLSTPK